MSPGDPTDRSRRLWLALGAVAALALVGIVAAILLTRGDGGGTTTALSGTTVSESTGEETTAALPTVTERTVLVPAVTGLSQTAATARLAALGLTALARTVPSPRAAGVVLDQNPAAGARLAGGGLVGLVVSSGPGAGIVPSVLGLTAAEAAAKLRAAGLDGRPQLVESAGRAGIVVAQSPVAGTRLRGGTVVLSVSKSAPHVAVPDVVGSTRAAAVGALRAAGFRAAIRLQPSPRPAGTVLSQIPGGGTSASRGSTVHLAVARVPSSPPADIAVPDVVGRRQAAAVRRLRAAGLTPRVRRVHSLLAVGTVVAQAPAAGSRLARDGRVSISISTGPGP